MLPPLFPKKNKESQQSRNDELEIFRAQDPDRPSTSSEFAREAMMASTRIRVKDGTHVHYGSGTIIDSQAGRAVILTCGHILRKLGKEAVIEVDLFAEGISNPQTTTAQILKYDLDADVGLLTISSQQRLPIVRLALAGELPKVKDRVFSIGCGGGKIPSIEEHAVTAINGFVGPDNLECTGVPLQGRSGGGLFMGAEQVGVCILADANYERGIYTGMQPVAKLLQKAGLDRLVSSTAGTNQIAENPPEMQNQATPDLPQPDVVNTDDASENSNVAGVSLAAREYEGAEIVCTIHSKMPGGVTRVIIINQASSRILNDLLHESLASGQAQPNVTAQNGPAKSNPEKSIGAALSRPEKTRSARMPIQSPALSRAPSIENNRPIETSFDSDFDSERSRRQRD